MKVTTTTKKTIERYDDKHYAVYFNPVEKQIESAVDGEQPSSILEYAMVLVECDTVPSKGEVVNAIIRERYTLSDEMAVQRHYANNPSNYAAEWQEYNECCEEAKRVANQIMEEEG